MRLYVLLFLTLVAPAFARDPYRLPRTPGFRPQHPPLTFVPPSFRQGRPVAPYARTYAAPNTGRMQTSPQHTEPKHLPKGFEAFVEGR